MANLSEQQYLSLISEAQLLARLDARHLPAACRVATGRLLIALVNGLAQRQGAVDLSAVSEFLRAEPETLELRLLSLAEALRAQGNTALFDALDAFTQAHPASAETALLDLHVCLAPLVTTVQLADADLLAGMLAVQADAEASPNYDPMSFALPAEPLTAGDTQALLRYLITLLSRTNATVGAGQARYAHAAQLANSWQVMQAYLQGQHGIPEQGLRTALYAQMESEPTPWLCFFKVVASEGLDMEKLYRLLVQCLVVAQFQAAFGLRSGRYIPVWDGAADIDHAARICAALPADAYLPQSLMRKLTEAYLAANPITA